MSAVDTVSGTASAILGMLIFLTRRDRSAPLAGIGEKTMLKMSLAVLFNYGIALTIGSLLQNA